MIRVATINDLDEVVQVHRACFPKSFTTAMGTRLLKRYYLEFMNKNPELFLISVSNADNLNQSINAFCMGYYGENSNCTKQFVKNNRFRFVLRVLGLLLIGNRAAWKRARGVLRKRKGTVTVDETFRPFTHRDSGELLSICVLPEFRGGGISSLLVDQYEKTLLDSGRHRLVLSVLADNTRAIRFYEKKGFLLFKKIGDTSLVYAKILKTNN